MAARYAIATGNWSNPAIWDGGVSVPTVGDTVRPNNFSVTIDQDITVTDLRSDAASPAIASGAFLVTTIPGGGRTINANVQSPASGGSGLVRVTAGSGTLTINGNLTGGSVASGLAVSLVGAACTVNIIGTLLGGSSTGFCHAVYWNSGSPIVTVTGPVTGGSSLGTAISAAGGGTLTINGIVTGGSAVNAVGVSIGVGSIVTINSNCIAGTSLGACVATAGTTTINGNVSGGTSVAGVTISSGTLDVTGTITASTTQHGISGVTGTSLTRIRGPLIDGSSGRQAIFLNYRILHAAPTITTWTVRDDSGFPTVGAAMVLTNIGVGMPDPTDVAAGVIYGPDDEFIGTMPIDINPADVWGYAVAAADEVGSMGARLRNASTPDTMGAQLAAAIGE